ncbi:restriction endonuclease subunit S [Sulfurimonas sp.]|uniref:restriction endonuclease subunit S n=1 Tax=Sulfurimonas sp. TaxID=2022749 RepID=UPI002624D68D|nr:restriction endonuclease subunit S [Sulfurimonas sp.]MCW8895486.1 restriction endonuclease subunit S [Sulfurimonas sp.]
MQVLEKYFDTAFDAPDGIKKLRELILTLAMQGKLVPQDTNDQPASELLKEIEKEKEKLVKDGKIKKSKPLGAVQPNEIPFEVPSTWEWIYLNELVSLLGDGLHGTPQYDDYGDYFFINGNNLNDGRIQIKENTKRVSTTEYEKYKKNLDDRTVLVSINGTLGNVAFFNNENVVLGKSACYFNLFSSIEKTYIKALINSKYFLEYANTQATGSTIKNVSLKSMRELKIPLPPVNEQKRIVEKINQLMALCDELEKLKEQKEAKKLTVHKSAINQLLDSKDDSNSQNGWRFISNHFNDLYTVKKNVLELRSAILQLVMQGKLVPQDPNDQPASELLKEIEKEKKANKVKSLEPIKLESIPYDLPNGWQWVYLNDFGIWKSGSTPSRTNSAYYGGDIPWVKSGEVKQGLIKNTEETITQKALDECSLGLNPVGSVLVAMYGANIGEVGILEVEATTNQAICACQTFSKINNQFLKFLIDSLKGYFISQGAGAAQPNISRVKIINSIVPLPPFNEQQRIVEKINQLMALCDDLEKQIENSSSKQTELLNAIMSNLGK